MKSKSAVHNSYFAAKGFGYLDYNIEAGLATIGQRFIQARPGYPSLFRYLRYAFGPGDRVERMDKFFQAAIGGVLDKESYNYLVKPATSKESWQ